MPAFRPRASASAIEALYGSQTRLEGMLLSSVPFEPSSHGSEASGRSQRQGVHGHEVPQSKSPRQKAPGAKDLAVRLLRRMRNASSEKWFRRIINIHQMTTRLEPSL